MTMVSYTIGLASLALSCEDASVFSLFERDTTPFLCKSGTAQTFTPTADISVKVRRGVIPAPPGDAREILLHNRDRPLFGLTWKRNQTSYVYNPHYTSLYTFTDREIVIDYAGDEFNAFIGLRLTVFPSLYRLSDGQGTVTVHASAVSSPSRGGLLFCGPKGSGKTSLALTLAALSGFGFVANDYSILSAAGETVMISGAPEPIRVAKGTYEAMLHRFGWAHNAAVINGKRYLNIREARHHLGLVRSARLSAVFMPVLSERDEFEAVRIGADAGASLMTAECLENSGYSAPSFALEGAGVPAAVIGRRLSLWLDSVPCFRLRVPYRLVGTECLARKLASLLTGVRQESS